MKQKYTLNVITAYNGVEVISLTPSEYVHTKFDDIVADWRRQQIEENMKRRKEEVSVKGIFRRVIKLLEGVKRYAKIL